MKAKNLYSIKFVSDRTGLKPYLIRTWESRYGAVVPKRTQTNRRKYCQNDIQKLHLLKLAVDQGHQISNIAGMRLSELRDLLEVMESAPSAAPKIRPETKHAVSFGEHYRSVSLQAVVDLDQDLLTTSLSDAAVQLTRRQWIEDLIVPLFKEIGDLWAAGELKIVNEHMASNCARMIMWDMLRSVALSSFAPKIILGTPVGQWHEMGALSAALAAIEAGWRPVYVGVNLPAEELASAMDQFSARCIGLSITHTLNDSCLQPELVNLRRYIGPGPCVIVGGLHGAQWGPLIEEIGARRMDCWQDLTRMLAGLAACADGRL